MTPLEYPMLAGRTDDVVYKCSQRQEVMRAGVPASLGSGHEHFGRLWVTEKLSEVQILHLSHAEFSVLAKRTFAH